MCRVSMSNSNDDSLGSSDRSSSERSVGFSTIEFHEHAMILGCSPATTSGPPLEIDWEKMSSATFSLDDYEEWRPPRRVKQQLIMPSFLREDVLLENGYTRGEIDRQLQRLKQERRASQRPSLQMPMRLLGQARRSLLGGSYLRNNNADTKV